MDYDYETIEAKMKSLPDDLQEAMTSFDTVTKIEEIGKKYNLAIDQIGALGDVTSYVMLGLVPGKDFVSKLSKKAEIDEKIATDIAKDINTEIFDGIRESIRKIEEKEETVVSPNNEVPQSSTTSLANPSPLTKEQILDEIENPPPFIDRLLAGPAGSVTEIVTQTVSQASQTQPLKIASPTSTPSATPKVDPYREPLE